MDRECVAPALGKISSGIYIATSRLEGRPVGMLCSFVEQAAFEPPMLTLAVGRNRLLNRAIEEWGKVGINVLSEMNGPLMKPFANRANDHPFEELPLAENPDGLPQLSEAMAFLACSVRQKLEAGDHFLYLAEVTDGVLQDSGVEPMVRVRKSGFQY